MTKIWIYDPVERRAQDAASAAASHYYRPARLAQRRAYYAWHKAEEAQPDRAAHYADLAGSAVKVAEEAYREAKAAAKQSYIAHGGRENADDRAMIAAYFFAGRFASRAQEVYALMGWAGLMGFASQEGSAHNGE